MMTNRGVLLVSASAAALLFASPARAEDAAPASARSDVAHTRSLGPSAGAADATHDIIVTALKRTESIQKVPASITALSGANLVERGISNVGALQFAVPSVEVGSVFGDTQITIRGIGLGPGGPSTAVYVDGIYQPIAALADLSAVDLARVEVLRGPQGTLYGRNANAGSVNFISNAPTQKWEGYLLGSYESFDEYKLQGMLNAPLGAGIAARLVVNYDDRQDGFVKNVIPGQEDLDKGKVLTGRLRIGGQITDDLSFDVNLEGKHATGPFQYFQLHNPINAAAIASVPLFADAIVPLRAWRTAANDPSDVHENYGLAGLTLTWKSPIGTVKSITAYQRYSQNALSDQDGTQISVFPNEQRITDHSLSEELNLSKQVGRFDAILGAFYLDERGTRSQFYPFPTGDPGFGAPPGSYLFDSEPQKDELSKAVYGDVTMRVTDRLRLIGGLRYSDDRQKIRVDNAFGATTPGGPIGQPGEPFFPPTTTCPDPTTKFDFDSVTGKVGVQYDVARSQNVYATYSTGYLDGGLNYTVCPTQNVFNPEKIKAYEIGYKSRLFDNHVTFNISAFYYDFTDLQVSRDVGVNVLTENAAGAHVKGIEAEAYWFPDSHLTFNANFSYLDAKYTDFFSEDPLNPFAVGVSRPTTIEPGTGGLVAQDVSGNFLSNAPRFSGNAGVAYRTDTYSWGSLVLRTDVAARSHFYLREFNDPLDEQKAYALVNLSAIWNAPGGRYTVRIFGNNVTNHAYLVTMGTSDTFGARYVTYGTPRQVGVELSTRF